MDQKKLFNIKNVVLMGMFGAIGGVLMLFEFPLPFIAPSFYGLDLSEIPVLVGTFAMGPVAGVITELVKILVKLVLKPTSTGFVGEFANVCIGCALILPAGMIYKFKKTKQGLHGHCGSCSQRGGDAAVLLQLYAFRVHFGGGSRHQPCHRQRMDLCAFCGGPL